MTYVKICGITNVSDALTAARAGADLLGFVFYPPSPRSVPPGVVAPIATAVRQHYPSILLVGVFVDEPTSQVAEVAQACDLGCVQLHGDEPPEAVDRLAAEGLLVIKGFRVRDGGRLPDTAPYRSNYHLLDTHVPGRPGGTGKIFDWRIVRTLRDSTPILMAGGLTADNVAEAVRVGAPWGVDVSSGVEASPGRKDPTKVRRFVAAAKGASGKAGSE